MPEVIFLSLVAYKPEAGYVKCILMKANMLSSDLLIDMGVINIDRHIRYCQKSKLLI